MAELKGIATWCAPTMVAKTKLAKKENGEYICISEIESKTIVLDILEIIEEYKDYASVSELIESIKMRYGKGEVVSMVDVRNVKVTQK